jgi:YHS domain-containing protein
VDLQDRLPPQELIPGRFAAVRVVTMDAIKATEDIMGIIRSAIAAVGALAFACAFAQAPKAGPRVALKGYDPVAYFTEQRPVKGAPQFQHDFDGDRYYFASARNRELFGADPDRYLPQFAAMCAVGIGMGQRIEADPTVWKIVDGKLYVFSSAQALEVVEKDPALLAKSRESWKAK